MPLLLDENALESPLKEMPYPPVAPIEGLPVEAVKLAHPAREVRLGGLDQQMVVVIHQDIGMQGPAKDLDGVRQGHHEARAVGSIAHDGAALVATGSHVVEG